MNHQNFVSEEEVSRQQNNIRTLYRYVKSLTLLRKVFVPTILVIFLAAAAPPYFLWFVGELVACAGQNGCSVTHDLLVMEVVIPVTISSLVMLTLVAMLCRVGAWMLFELCGQWSTQGIHADMMASVSNVRTTFFDENPSGRLINRLLGDYGMLRLEGVMSLGDTANGLAEVLCVGLLIMLANPVAGLLIIPVVMLYVALQMQLAPMMSHARELRAVRIGEALHRETDLIEGRTIFTLYGKQKNLLDRIHRAYGDSMNIQLFYARLMGWGMLWMGAISAGYAIIVYGFLIYGLHGGLISTGLAAVIITAVFNLNSTFFGLAWDMSFLGETASHARRAFFMIDLPDQITQESRLHPVAGSTQQTLSGDIRFEEYSMSYRAGQPLILDGLTLTIPYGQKVGIMGRTGAGKSSLMQALFRMVYHQGGDIRIGDISIFDVDIHCLRRHFGVVPQDPYLFSGTIRFNLVGELTRIPDERLAEVLTSVGLDLDLDARVLEGGRDYSVGERQLLCIARLILLDKQYILMDEPTSALDRRTDDQMQRLMSTALADRTVITIAHRLESLERYDLILELADGRLLRQGSPAELISLPDSPARARLRRAVVAHGSAQAGTSYQ
ncbi:MAG: ABC transporter ATP-binding protein/permease [Proteobacteria bacterium]|nr:ABC transporter ATP-binding protein/permease [Pseudomonadota bacterium]